MTFIVILIALLIERFFDWSHLRNWDWFCSLQSGVVRRSPKLSPYFVLAATVIPLLIIVVLINFFLVNLLYGFIYLIFNLFILLYCIGPRNLWADTFASLTQLAQGDTQLTHDKLLTTFGIAESSNLQLMQQKLLGRIFIESNRRVFAIIFWYILLGSFGVILYRAIAISNDPTREVPQALAESANQVEGLLDWIPSRLLTFFFALGGQFVQVLSAWQQDVLREPAYNDHLLTECGAAALGYDREALPTNGTAEKYAISLIDRVLVIVLVLLGMSAFVLFK